MKNRHLLPNLAGANVLDQLPNSPSRIWQFKGVQEVLTVLGFFHFA